MSIGTGQVTVAAIAIVPTLLAAWFTWRTSVSANKTALAANRTNDKKVDAEVFERTQGLYDRAVAAARQEIDRLQAQQERFVTQLDRMTVELWAERETSGKLRAQVAQLQGQVELLGETIASLRRQIEVLSAGRPALDPPATGLAPA